QEGMCAWIRIELCSECRIESIARFRIEANMKSFAMRLSRMSRPECSRWQLLMSHWGRFARSLGLFSIHQRPIRRQAPLSLDRLESRDAPSDTLSALLGNLGAFHAPFGSLGLLGSQGILRSAETEPVHNGSCDKNETQTGQLPSIGVLPSTFAQSEHNR